MIKILYGSKNYAWRALGEIEEGRSVVLNVLGWRRRFVRHMVLLFIEFDQLSRKGKVSRGFYFSFGWKSLLSLLIMGSITGLCHEARSAGMAVAMDEKGEVLEIKFERIKGFTH